MEYRILIQFLGSVVFWNCVLSTDSHAGTGVIVPRDTDKVSELKGKLSRLNNLFSELDDRDVSDLLSLLAHNKDGGTPIRTVLSSEDMTHVQHSKEVLSPAPSPTSGLETGQKRVGLKQNVDQLSPRDSISIEILAKALARMKEPITNTGDSTGDYLATNNNEVPSEREKTRVMENMIAKALVRLSEDKSEDTRVKPVYREPNSGLLQEPAFQDRKQREEAMRIIEARIMKYILLANNQGISIRDIIKDLDNKANEEYEQEKIEEEMEALNQYK